MNYLNKDIGTVEAPALILHGVNCQRAMGSGVAKALYSKWPQVREEYMRFSKEEMHLGKIASVKVDDNLFVVNCWTQEKYGYDNSVYANAEAIEGCLQQEVSLCKETQIAKIFAPRIGCGLGGLNWDRDVLPIFEHAEQKNPEIEITICDFN